MLELESLETGTQKARVSNMSYVSFVRHISTVYAKALINFPCNSKFHTEVKVACGSNFLTKDPAHSSGSIVVMPSAVHCSYTVQLILPLQSNITLQTGLKVLLNHKVNQVQ